MPALAACRDVARRIYTYIPHLHAIEHSTLRPFHNAAGSSVKIAPLLHVLAFLFFNGRILGVGRVQLVCFCVVSNLLLGIYTRISKNNMREQ